jgi:predicted permease
LPWRSRAGIARDVDAELSFHLDMRVAELMAQGLSDGDARQRAREEFGDVEFTRAYCRAVDARADRAVRFSDRLTDWRQDLRYAVRTLRRSPGFTILSLLTLAIAVGANTAIFSVVQAVLLEPLPYGNPGALVRVYETEVGHEAARVQLSPPDFADYGAQQRGLTGIAGYFGGRATWLPASGDPRMLNDLSVSANTFGVLQVHALRGRTFSTGDDTPGRDQKVVLSYAFWRNSLGENPAVIGGHMTLNGASYDVLGVMPPGFSLGRGEDLWTPLDLHDDLADAARTRKQHYVNVIGRLASGVATDRAQANLAVISRRLAAAYPAADSGRAAVLVPLRDAMVGDLRPALLLLQAAALMVLLIACANLANLALSRTLGRRRELAVRAALGAGRGRLVRQLLTESVLLAIVGGAAGAALAASATRAIMALNANALPAMFSATVDGRVLLFSVALSAAAGVVFGVLPAMEAARANLHDSLKEGARGASGGLAAAGARRLLVAAQVALAAMLLVAAGLLVRSFTDLTQTQLGFDPDHVLTAQVSAGGAQYDSTAAMNRLFDQVLGDVAHTPGVAAVGATDIVPTQGRISSSLRVVGQLADEANLPDIGYLSVRGDYFKVMRIPLLAGREYDARDLPDGPKTVIINDAAARRFFPKGNAVGQSIHIGPNPNAAPMRIVGVVGDIRDEGFGAPTQPTLFANHRQEAWERTMSIVVRTSGSPESAAPALRRALHHADPTLALRDVSSLNDVLATSLAPRWFALALAACFGGIALLLAAIGIYGVLAHAVTLRTREFGVRFALGAPTASVLLLVVRQGLAWALVGLVAGVAGALAGARLLAGMLYGVTPLDASTYVAVTAVLLGVVIAACVVPAARAARVDPLESLRAE